MIDIIEQMAVQASQGMEETTHDVNGIRHCNTCNEPRQEWILMLDEMRKMPVPCACIRAEAEARKEQEKKERFDQLVRELREDGIRDKKFQKCTFESDNEPRSEASIMARQYLTNWKKMYSNNYGIIFTGNVGTGKTFLACSIANALINKGISSRVTSLPTILSEIQGTWDKSGYVARLMQYDLLVIDDFGTERTSDYGMEQVINIVEKRLNSERPLIVTTNISIGEMDSVTDLAKQRINSRLREMCPIIIPCTGVNKRAESTAGRENDSIQLLFGGEQ